MKKILACMLAFICLLVPAASQAMGFQPQGIALPEDSTVFSPSFATQAITLCQVQPQMLAFLGLKVVHQDHLDKDPADASHTSGYTVCQGSVQYKGETRPLMVVIVNGTTGGEWYSNFDFAPSRDGETQFAENFYAAAQDIYAGCQPVFAQVEKPLVVLTGYSRGAACANLLGMLMNQDYGVENVFVYTAATPNTVRGDAAKIECPNIFNVINPCDMVTCLPLSGWGYTRLGQDIVLPGDEAVIQQVQDVVAQIAAAVPDIEAYYTVKHNLMGAGESPIGMTAYNAMLLLSELLIGNAQPTATAALQMLSPESDLAPVVQFFLTTPDNPVSLMTQHAPTAYAQLFLQMQAEP